MDEKEVRRKFLTRVWDYLVSLPFDAKILQEAASDPDLDPSGREMAASVLLHVMSHHEGTGPERYIEDLFLVRAALHRVGGGEDEGGVAFRARFSEVYGTLDADVQVFHRVLGAELWQWLLRRTDGFSRLLFKGKRAANYVEDADALELLYEEGQEFQTNYNVTEAQVQNRLRRPEQICEYLTRRCADETRKRGAERA